MKVGQIKELNHPAKVLGTFCSLFLKFLSFNPIKFVLFSQ